LSKNEPRVGMTVFLVNN